MTSKRQIRCAIYTRKSSEEGLEQDFNSLDAQREACEAYVASQKSEGWVALREHFDDGGFSGGTLERPALQRLLKEIETGKVDVVVVYKIDRLSRSLMDFAKLVEVFERRSVTFVSVTQSFNTTTSMGRLTLNVLLSFAQFEREVTGERIRDKFAASKKKGMWMGGCPPLGYDIDSRKLVVNAAEAKTVNLIFRRYLDLGCVRTLRDDLAERRIISKVWTSTSGRAHGGTPFDRGALYCLLKNRAYVGETTHKGKSYPGEHKGIVARELFNAVQEQLASSRRRTPGKASVPQEAPLAGLIFDDRGTAMVPTYSMKPDGRRYCYYASRQSGERSSRAIARVPATAIEDLLAAALTRLDLATAEQAKSGDLRSLIQRIELGTDHVSLQLDRAEAFRRWRAGEAAGFKERDIIAYGRAKLGTDELLTEEKEHLILALPVRARFRGGRAQVLSAPGTGPSARMPDAPLIKALAKAHRWRAMLEVGEVGSVEALAGKLKQERKHVGAILNLAFLAPDLTKAILNGEQPQGLRLAHLLAADIPLSWAEQRAMFRQVS
ncbi:MAG TPA: recombinase family protein [Rhizomicrobium sp.]|nr:recombinase family protein [Rhizomicrobium sp.]